MQLEKQMMANPVQGLCNTVCLLVFAFKPLEALMYPVEGLCVIVQFSHVL